jgi:rhodanese-related sulfurtransferase
MRGASRSIGVFVVLAAACSAGDPGSTSDADAAVSSDAHLPVDIEVGLVDSAAAWAWPSGEYISVDDVYARQLASDPDMLPVNVVDEEYYNLGFIPGSLKIPWDTLAGRLGELDPDRHIVIYCRKGVRSESAYSTLRSGGFPLVWVMEGGVERWVAAGYPTVSD